MKYNFFYSSFSHYKRNKDLEQISTTLATIGGLFFIVWLISLSNLFSLKNYAEAFFVASVFFLFAARIIRENNIPSKLSELVALSVMYLIFLYLLSFFKIISEMSWILAINTLLFLCIVLVLLSLQYHLV